MKAHHTEKGYTDCEGCEEVKGGKAKKSSLDVLMFLCLPAFQEAPRYKNMWIHPTDRMLTISLDRIRGCPSCWALRVWAGVRYLGEAVSKQNSKLGVTGDLLLNPSGMFKGCYFFEACLDTGCPCQKQDPFILESVHE